MADNSSQLDNKNLAQPTLGEVAPMLNEDLHPNTTLPWQIPGFSASTAVSLNGASAGSAAAGAANNGSLANPNVPTVPVNIHGGALGALEMAKKYVGQNSWDLKGKLPNYDNAGRTENNCACFVSACLISNGVLDKPYLTPSGLENALQRQGYVKVPLDKAAPGDVWFTGNRGHVEFVADAGAVSGVGSNGSKYQKVTVNGARCWGGPGQTVYRKVT